MTAVAGASVAGEKTREASIAWAGPGRDSV